MNTTTTLPHYEVFICGSNKDLSVATDICKALDDAGISYFCQPMEGNDDIENYDYLFKMITSCDIFLLLASENSYDSKFVKAAITYAFNEYARSNIIPYIIDASEMPPGFKFIFSSVNWRDMRTMSISPALVNDLCIALGRTVTVDIDTIAFEETSYCSLGDGHNDGITALNIDKKSETIISGAKNGTVCLWDVFMGELKMNPIAVFDKDDCDEINGVYLFNKSDLLAACDGRTVRLWDIQKGETVRELKASRFAINPAGNYLAVAEGHVVKIYGCDTWKLIFEIEIPHFSKFVYPCFLCFSPDGKYLAIADGVGNIFILNTESKKLEEFDDPEYEGDTTYYLRQGCSDTIFSMAYSPNGKNLFIASGKGVTICTEMNPLSLRLIPCRDVVESISSSPDGKYFATANYVGVMNIFRSSDGKSIYNRRRVDINQVMFAFDGEFLVTGDIYGSVAVWPLYQ